MRSTVAHSFLRPIARRLRSQPRELRYGWALNGLRCTFQRPASNPYFWVTSSADSLALSPLAALARLKSFRLEAPTLDTLQALRFDEDLRCAERTSGDWRATTAVRLVIGRRLSKARRRKRSKTGGEGTRSGHADSKADPSVSVPRGGGERGGKKEVRPKLQRRPRLDLAHTVRGTNCARHRLVREAHSGTRTPAAALLPLTARAQSWRYSTDSATLQTQLGNSGCVPPCCPLEGN